MDRDYLFLDICQCRNIDFSMPTFGENFRAVLERRGLTQVAAAKALNASQSVVSYYSNLTRPPRRGTLLNIADRLGVSVEELVGEKGGAPKQAQTLDSDEALRQAMYGLKKRWRKSPGQRESVRHLISLLFPDEASNILKWLDQG